MNVHTRIPNDESVRDDFVPADAYFSKEFAALEKERLWPRVWQMACREEEIPKVGDYYTHDILDDSIIVMRTSANEIKAFHNACAHRGRRLTAGCGHTARLHCKFHGWQFDLEGKCVTVIDRDDWGAKLKDEDISLIPVKVGRWGGWVFINMDPNSETLEEALSPAKAFLDPFEFDTMRYHWRKSAIVPCNWKIVLEAFNEGYHLQQTHKQLLPYTDDYTTSFAHGRHGQFGYWDALPVGFPSKRLGPPTTDDIRPGILAQVEEMVATINSTESAAMLGAARRLVAEVPAGTPVMEALMKLDQFMVEEATGRGVTLPGVGMQERIGVGADWHLFPNLVFIPGVHMALGYRARPLNDDPNMSIFDVFSLARYAPGEEPKPEQLWSDDLADVDFWGLILTQDFQNIAEVQKGVKSRGFRGCRTNPVQEVAVSNFHRALREFVSS
jgi:nitrite reductase/ring-hydroxylating ferredoxin subunit